MIKGIFLGVSIALIVVSLILIFSGISGNLGPNLITGQVIGEAELVGWGFAGLAVGILVGLIVVFRFFS